MLLRSHIQKSNYLALLIRCTAYIAQFIPSRWDLAFMDKSQRDGIDVAWYEMPCLQRG